MQKWSFRQILFNITLLALLISAKLNNTREAQNLHMWNKVESHQYFYNASLQQWYRSQLSAFAVILLWHRENELPVAEFCLVLLMTPHRGFGPLIASVGNRGCGAAAVLALKGKHQANFPLLWINGAAGTSTLQLPDCSWSCKQPVYSRPTDTQGELETNQCILVRSTLIQ